MASIAGGERLNQWDTYDPENDPVSGSSDDTPTASGGGGGHHRRNSQVSQSSSLHFVRLVSDDDDDVECAAKVLERHAPSPSRIVGVLQRPPRPRAGVMSGGENVREVDVTSQEYENERLEGQSLDGSGDKRNKSVAVRRNLPGFRGYVLDDDGSTASSSLFGGLEPDRPPMTQLDSKQKRLFRFSMGISVAALLSVCLYFVATVEFAGPSSRSSSSYPSSSGASSSGSSSGTGSSGGDSNRGEGAGSGSLPSQQGSGGALPTLTANAADQFGGYGPPEGPITVKVDPVLQGSLMNTNVPHKPGRDVPLFWDVPLAGGNGVESVFGVCAKLVQCSEVGVMNGDGNDQILRVVDVYGNSYVNVDTSTVEGIDRAVSLSLGTAGIADVIHSPLIYESLRLFEPPIPAYGRMFALFRHPIERAVATYHYLKAAHWDPRHNIVQGQTLREYAAVGPVENNLLTRSLVNKPGGALTQQDAVLAQEILRRKCIVGLYDDMEISLHRFERFFGWHVSSSADMIQCHIREVANEKESQYNNFEKLQESSEEYQLLQEQNRFDVAVFQYVRSLYEYQGRNIFNMVKRR